MCDIINSEDVQVGNFHASDSFRESWKDVVIEPH